MFTSLTLLSLLAYLISACLFSRDVLTREKPVARWSVRFLYVAMLCHVAAVLWGLAETGFSSLLSLPNGLLPVALLLVVGYLVLARVYPIRQLGTLVTPLAAVLLTLAVFHGLDARVSEPVRGTVLPIHVALAFSGTVAFTLAFFAAAVYWLQAYQLKHKRFGTLFRSLPALDVLDRVSFRCVAIGFPLYTGAILLGVLWAWHGAGARTTIDTGYVLAGVSWLLYGTVLQTRLTFGWRGARAAVVTVIGFLSAAGVVVAYLLR